MIKQQNTHNHSDNAFKRIERNGAWLVWLLVWWLQLLLNKWLILIRMYKLRNSLILLFFLAFKHIARPYTSIIHQNLGQTSWACSLIIIALYLNHEKDKIKWNFFYFKETSQTLHLIIFVLRFDCNQIKGCCSRVLFVVHHT